MTHEMQVLIREMLVCERARLGVRDTVRLAAGSNRLIPLCIRFDIHETTGLLAQRALGKKLIDWLLDSTNPLVKY